MQKQLSAKGGLQTGYVRDRGLRLTGIDPELIAADTISAANWTVYQFNIDRNNVSFERASRTFGAFPAFHAFTVIKGRARRRSWLKYLLVQSSLRECRFVVPDYLIAWTHTNLQAAGGSISDVPG